MPKNSRKQIDTDENKVISELQRNSKESIDKIAKKCGFSRQKVWRIIKRLEKNKTIWGYHAVIDEEKINLKSYLLLIKRSNEPMDKNIMKMIQDMSAKKFDTDLINIKSLHYLHGAYDFVVNMTASDIKQAKKFIEIINQTHSKYFSEILLIEKIFSLKKCEILNPNPEKIKEFF